MFQFEMIDKTLPLWLLPGLISALVGLGWLYWHGIRRGWAVWILTALVTVWSVGIILAIRDRWISGLLIWSLASAGLIVLVVWFIWRENDQRTEIARLHKLAEEPSERINVLSHDIGTPLTIIKGRLEQLLDGHPGPLTSLQAEFLRAAYQECEKIIALAKDLLRQAPIESGVFNLRPELVDIGTLVRQVVTSVRLLADKCGQVISLDYPQVMEPVWADSRLLALALTNLLTNASRFTSQGGHIYVTVADNEENVVITVMDDGAGMTPEERRLLFQKFASSRRFSDGTGLGLVITRQIIELHGGKIFVDAELGRGTTFLFTIPRRDKCENNGSSISYREEKENAQTARTGRR